MDNQPMDEAEARQQPGVARVYRNEQIAVTWEPALCIHVGHCFRDLPEVFQPQNRPWVNINGATANRIAEQVRKCPSGALRFVRLDGAAAEPPPSEVTIEVRPNGPLLVKGTVHIRGADGQLIRETTQCALCRCGHSENKPFCDATHRRIGFRAA